MLDNSNQDDTVIIEKNHQEIDLNKTNPYNKKLKYSAIALIITFTFFSIINLLTELISMLTYSFVLYDSTVYFTSSLCYSLYACHLLTLTLSLGFCIYFEYDLVLLGIYYNQVGHHIIISLSIQTISLIINLIRRLILLKYFGFNIVSLILNFINLINLFYLYRKIVVKRNLTYMSIICIFTLKSWAISYSLYCVLYNFFYLMSHAFYHSELAKTNLFLLAKILYAASSMIIVTLHKDVIYCFAFLLLEIGCLNIEFTTKIRIMICSITIIIVIFVSTVLTIAKHRKEVFNLDNSNQIMDVIDNYNMEEVINN